MVHLLIYEVLGLMNYDLSRTLKMFPLFDLVNSHLESYSKATIGGTQRF